MEILGTIDSIGEESLSHAHCPEHKLTAEIKKNVPGKQTWTRKRILEHLSEELSVKFST